MTENEEHIITLEELKENVQKIEKRIILVNSSKYTEEAFEYLLDLIDENETIAFIINERKIYTHGEYFGGDLWEDSLNYFSKYVVLDDSNSIVSQIYAQSSKDAIQFKGEGGVALYTDYDLARDANTVHINYDLKTAVDESAIVTVNDETVLKLGTVNNKIKIEKYVPIKVNISDPSMLEYDTGNCTVTIPIDIIGSERLKTLQITASNNAIAEAHLPEKYISVTVFNNTDTIIYVDFSDGIVSLTETAIQRWGYGFFAGDTPFSSENIINAYRIGVEKQFSEKEISIQINDGKYGWFAYPSNVELTFIDKDTGLSGGWKKHSKFARYTSGIEYQVYRTEQSGLGKTTWKITKKL